MKEPLDTGPLRWPAPRQKSAGQPPKGWPLMDLPHVPTQAMTHLTEPLLSTHGRVSSSQAFRRASLLLAATLMVLVWAEPGFAQRCQTKDGQTICCDNSGNCYSK